MADLCLVCERPAQFQERETPEHVFCSKDCQQLAYVEGNVLTRKFYTHSTYFQLYTKALQTGEPFADLVSDWKLLWPNREAQSYWEDLMRTKVPLATDPGADRFYADAAVKGLEKFLKLVQAPNEREVMANFRGYLSQMRQGNEAIARKMAKMLGKQLSQIYY